jgi:hypothetical protein
VSGNTILVQDRNGVFRIGIFTDTELSPFMKTIELI